MKPWDMSASNFEKGQGMKKRPRKRHQRKEQNQERGLLSRAKDEKVLCSMKRSVEAAERALEYGHGFNNKQVPLSRAVTERSEDEG